MTPVAESVDTGKFEPLGQHDQAYASERPDAGARAKVGGETKYSGGGDSIAVTGQDLRQCADMWDSTVEPLFMRAEKEFNDMKRLLPGVFPGGVELAEKFDAWHKEKQHQFAIMRGAHRQATATLRETYKNYTETDDANAAIAGSTGHR
jgi:hypothetical protein